MSPAQARSRLTPLRNALKPGSSLLGAVQNGLTALTPDHIGLIERELRPQLTDSLDLDAATRHSHPQENRWDYLVGVGLNKVTVALEAHAAKDNQVSNVIAKRQSILQVLSAHLKPGAKVSRWLWLASGKVQFAKTESARLRLSGHGIEFVGNQLRRDHLGLRAGG